MRLADANTSRGRGLKAHTKGLRRARGRGFSAPRFPGRWFSTITVTLVVLVFGSVINMGLGAMASLAAGAMVSGYPGAMASGAAGAVASGDTGAMARPVVGENVPVTSISLQAQQANNSPSIASDPTRPSFMVLAGRVDALEFNCSLAVSGDGGRSWLPARPVPQLPKGVDRCYAPEVAFDEAGVLHYLFVGLRGRGNQPVGAYLTRSSDRGRTFTPVRRILGPLHFGVRMAIDRTQGRQGRMHLVWLKARTEPSLGGFTQGPNPIMSAFSDDGGETFSNPVIVAGARGERIAGPALAVGAEKRVSVAFYDLGDDAIDYQGLEGPRWPGEWSINIASSRDGGLRFSKAGVVEDAVVPAERVMLIFTMPPPSLIIDEKGRQLVAWDDARNGDRDVFFRRSVRGGRAFSEPARLNDDQMRNGKDQYLPRLSAAPGGRIDAIYFDRRSHQETTKTDVFYTFSQDGARTFEPNTRLTSQSFDTRTGARYPIPSAAGLVDFGSRLGLWSKRSGAVAAWPDTRNVPVGFEHQDIFSTQITFSRRSSTR